MMWRSLVLVGATLLLIASGHPSPARRTPDGELAARRRSAVDKTFIRFGRSPQRPYKDDVLFRFGRSEDFLRFGKSLTPENAVLSYRPYEDEDANRLHKRKPTNFLRLGRTASRENFLRIGRRHDNFLRYGRSNDNAGNDGYEINGELMLTHHAEDNNNYDEESEAKTDDESNNMNAFRLAERDCPDCYLQ